MDDRYSEIVKQIIEENEGVVFDARFFKYLTYVDRHGFHKLECIYFRRLIKRIASNLDQYDD